MGVGPGMRVHDTVGGLLEQAKGVSAQRGGVMLFNGPLSLFLQMHEASPASSDCEAFLSR